MSRKPHEVRRYQGPPIPQEPLVIEEIPQEPAPIEVPQGWTKGQLLNVRNTGPDYVITLLGEEYDPRHPNRALRFTNPAECQSFISTWYSREHSDPRA